MIKVAIQDRMGLADANIDEVIDHIACDVGFRAAHIVRYSNAIDFSDKLAPEKSVLVDLAFVPYSMLGISGLGAIAEARALLPTLRAVIVADKPDYAAEAAAAKIEGYLVEPISCERFENVTLSQMKAVLKLRASSFIINSRSGTRRLRFGKVLYCQTSGHDQIIYLANEPPITTRFSSQAMYELLSADNRFFKLGSSNIINLDEVVETRGSEGMVELSNGTVLSVPVRLRKPLEDALLNGK